MKQSWQRYTNTESRTCAVCKRRYTVEIPQPIETTCLIASIKGERITGLVYRQQQNGGVVADIPEELHPLNRLKAERRWCPYCGSIEQTVSKSARELLGKRPQPADWDDETKQAYKRFFAKRDMLDAQRDNSHAANRADFDTIRKDVADTLATGEFTEREAHNIAHNDHGLSAERIRRIVKGR